MKQRNISIGLPRQSSGYDWIPSAGGTGSVPGWGPKTLHTAQQYLKKKKKRHDHIILNLQFTENSQHFSKGNALFPLRDYNFLQTNRNLHRNSWPCDFLRVTKLPQCYYMHHKYIYMLIIYFTVALISISNQAAKNTGPPASPMFPISCSSLFHNGGSLPSCQHAYIFVQVQKNKSMVFGVTNLALSLYSVSYNLLH